MWLTSSVLVLITIQVNGAKKHHKHEDNVPRFVIPHPLKHESVFLPRATSVVKKSGSIVGTELPGAYGEDFEIENGFESGSGGTSASGSGSDEADVIFVARNGEAAETAGRYGNNLSPMPPANPASAYVNKEKDTNEEEAIEENDTSYSTKHDKNNKVEKTDKTESLTQVEKITKPEVFEKPANTVKTDKTDKPKSNKKISKHKGSSHKVDESNMISKIDAIARQIERVEHKEKLDRKEEATLKVAKKVAKTVIKDFPAKKETLKVEKKESSVEKSGEGQPEKETERAINGKKESAHSDEPTGPEGFECPWACFWACHSYCPKECCHNPYKCDIACREMCTPYCSDRCCAPGSRRLPKLKLTFPTSEDAKNRSYGKAEIKHATNTSVDIIDTAENARLNPAENSYQQQKVHQEKIAYTTQMDALKKAASYAANLMGLPSDCPLACARICLPGLCKPACCTRLLPNSAPKYHYNLPIADSRTVAVAPAPAAMTSHKHAALPGNIAHALSGIPVVPFASVPPTNIKTVSNSKVSQLTVPNQLRVAPKQNKNLMPSKMPIAAFHQLPIGNYAMNKIAYQNKLQGKAMVPPALAQYRAMAYANQMNNQKMLLTKTIQARSGAAQMPNIGSLCQFPSPACQSPLIPTFVANCPTVCRSSCLPKCPNECCVPPMTARGVI